MNVKELLKMPKRIGTHLFVFKSPEGKSKVGCMDSFLHNIQAVAPFLKCEVEQEYISPEEASKLNPRT